MILEEIGIPIYKGLFVLILNPSHEEVQEVIPEFSDNDVVFAHSWRYRWGKDGKEGFIMILSTQCPLAKLDHGTIAHEAIHIKNMVFELRGIHLDPDNDEAEAYFVGWLITEIYKVLEENKIKI